MQSGLEPPYYYYLRGCREDRYFYSMYDAGSIEPEPAAEIHRLTVDSPAGAVNSYSWQYCGPVNTEQLLNPVRSLSYEFIDESPTFAKFLRIISSNAIVLSVLFTLASVSRTSYTSSAPSLYPPSERSKTGGYTVLLAFPSVREHSVFRCKYLENGLVPITH